MLRIDCPFCGLRDHSEFSYGEDASITYPELDNPDRKAWYEAVFLRDNPRGAHVERWHHVQGCRQWLIVERDTVSHEISSVKMARSDVDAALKAPRMPRKTSSDSQAKSGVRPKTKKTGASK